MTTTDILSSRVADLERNLAAALRRIQQLERPTPVGGVRRGHWKAKLDGALSQGGSATASLWYHDGTNLVDQGSNVTVYDWYLPSGGSISSGKKVVIVKMQDGKWWAVGAEEECP